MALAMYLASLLHAQADAPAPDDFPVCEELPAPFLFLDGHRVRTVEDWRKRRKEMLDLILRCQYGTMPPAPGDVRVIESREPETQHDGLTRHECVRIAMGPDARLATTVHICTPAKGDAPFRAVLRVGWGDAAVPAMNERGYAFVCFEQRELDPDTEGYDCPGPAQMLYPDYTWGSVAVWAWGASRVLDYLETRGDIDMAHVAVTGHSRCGKVALLAGATDERFALVVPNGSGCGGAATYRVAGERCETLKLITEPARFKSWFADTFGRWADKETRLPFDQHFLRALVAPRLVLSTDALGDTWANPKGTQAAWLGAQPVFDFLGVPKNNMMHFREGNHDQLPEDFAALLDAADLCFDGKPVMRDFYSPAFPDVTATRSWQAPE